MYCLNEVAATIIDKNRLRMGECVVRLNGTIFLHVQNQSILYNEVQKNKSKNREFQ